MYLIMEGRNLPNNPWLGKNITTTQATTHDQHPGPWIGLQLVHHIFNVLSVIFVKERPSTNCGLTYGE